MKSRSLIVIILSVLSLLGVGASLPTVQAQSIALQYSLQYTEPAYPGATIILVNSFTNSGTLTERVTSVTITLDFATYTASSGLPVTVPVGQKVELNMTVQVPSSASEMSHSATCSIDFQYMDPSSSQWVTPNISPLTTQGSINITANPGGLAVIGFVILGVIAALALAVVFLVIRMRRKPKLPPVPPSPVAVPPPPAPPPTQ